MPQDGSRFNPAGNCDAMSSGLCWLVRGVRATYLTRIMRPCGPGELSFLRPDLP